MYKNRNNSNKIVNDNNEYRKRKIIINNQKSYNDKRQIQEIR